jgi:hypothetical protein
MALLGVDAPASPMTQSRGDLFPEAGHVSAVAATGFPFLGLAELGVGLTDGVAIGAFGGITVADWARWAAGVRPRFSVHATERTSFVLNVPILYYPTTSTPGGPFGNTSWLLARAELFVDRALGSRWHLAGGLGIVAAASTKAIGDLVSGHEVVMPPYDGNPQATKGVAGGIFDTFAGRGSYAIAPDTHLFAEASLVMNGIVPATAQIGGPPLVLNMGVQHAF